MKNEPDFLGVSIAVLILSVYSFISGIVALITGHEYYDTKQIPVCQQNDELVLCRKRCGNFKQEQS